MKYYLDTEFLERPNTIELISIGINCEDGRELYEISNEFNLRRAWKDSWIRSNVLYPIFHELSNSENDKRKRVMPAMKFITDFNYKNMKYLLKVYGKSIKEIANNVLDFSAGGYFLDTNLPYIEKLKYPLYGKFKPEFYAYYASYDWVVFCWIFGKMIDLPKGFPMYCTDLKPMLDEVAIKFDNENKFSTLEHKIKNLKLHNDFPVQYNEHNALYDAIWNEKLHNFLIKIKGK